MLLNAFKDIDLAVKTGKTVYMEVGGRRGMMAIVHITVGSNLYGKVKTFNYLESLLTNQNSIHEETKCRLKSGNSVQTLLKFSLRI